MTAQSETGRPHQHDALEGMRQTPLRLLTALAWLHVPIVAGAAYAAGNDAVVLGGVVAVLALVATFARRIAGADVGRAVLLVAVQGQVAAIVAALAGHPWQVDAHMYFFAVMALGVMLLDIGALLAAAGAVAVHHLSLNFFAAALVYPGGGDIGRTLIHAVVLIVETGGLIVAVRYIQKSIFDAFDSRAVAETELAAAEQAQARADEVESESVEHRRAMMETLGSSLGDVVNAAEAGDFSRRAQTDFEADELNRLGEAVNRLVAKVETVVSSAVGAMERIAAGDLRTQMDGDFGGRFYDLQNGVNATAVQLSSLVENIRGLSASIAEETRTVASSASEQAGRAESQASSLEETAATMEEMTATIKANSENAGRGRASADEAAERAERGGAVVRETVDAMGRIEESATRISDIIGVIDGIAFQTNLLALNAAVEAARAGDAGKGFAVVAQEVRGLAQRSAEAASDIKGLIAESSAQVATGVDLVNRTGGSLDEIVEAIKNVSATVSEISEATREQSAAVDEINSAISHIDQMTQENAAMASSSSSAASSLARQGDSLTALVSTFKTSASSSSAPTVARDVEEAAADAAWSETETASQTPTSTPSRAALSSGGASDGSWAEF